MNYYNEIDPYCVQWLKNLIVADLIPDGFVDSRPIQQVQPEDLRGFTQCHFFAGIAGWALALKLAGWPEDRQVWTGSCPCQPFSPAGRHKGFEDERHLWPTWKNLIAELRPSVIFGEQTSRAIAFGWLDVVADDLEGAEYAFASAVLPACSVKAPHGRDRIWFVADSEHRRLPIGRGAEIAGACLQGSDGVLVNDRPSVHGEENSALERILARGTPPTWEAEPTMDRVAYGVPNRPPKIRAYGNAIVPQVAAEFIGAYMDSEGFLDLL